MKRILFFVAVVCVAVGWLSACRKEGGRLAGGDALPGHDGIVLDLASSSLPLSRAVAEGPEIVVDHLDVLIFDEATQTKVWHERVSENLASERKITLAARRSDFAADATYWVYLIANSTHTDSEFAALSDLTALRSMTQSDRLIHVTGIRNITTAPQAFLMDGVAYPAAEAAEPVPQPVVLNNGVAADNTELKVVLRRAAAKILIHIAKGDAVEFLNETSGVQTGYYLRNLPYTTSLVAGVDAEAELRTSNISMTDYFAWTPSEITITAYAYAHEWANASALEQETRLVVNIPLRSGETDYPNSYYQIPVSRSKRLERNTCYEVSVTINAPGAIDPAEPVELTDLSYDVQPWEDTVIQVGGEGNRPIYLTLNTAEMEMNNSDTDNTTLHFASSSDVTVRVARVYYIDKFGQRQETTSASTIAAMGIQVTPDEGLTGNIGVYSPLPTNNTVRYIELEVTNADNVTRTVLVTQYPLECITNILGWYSYRSDFGGTTYELLKGMDVSGRTFASDNRIQDWICGCSWNTWNERWSYGETETGFFGSKVAGPVATSGSNAGKAHIYYYQWDESVDNQMVSPWPPSYESYYTYSVRNGNDVWRTYANPRMYHVQLTATSGEYTLGRPRITNGITDPGADNAQLVSPSFMIASQLGAVASAESVEMAASHCEQYVEVYKDENGNAVHLDDWRLPTKAELEIIMKYQHTSDAMDEVLAGEAYWSASGLVTNDQATSFGTRAIRCIRDAY